MKNIVILILIIGACLIVIKEDKKTTSVVATKRADLLSIKERERLILKGEELLKSSLKKYAITYVERNISDWQYLKIRPTGSEVFSVYDNESNLVVHHFVTYYKTEVNAELVTKSNAIETYYKIFEDLSRVVPVINNKKEVTSLSIIVRGSDKSTVAFCSNPDGVAICHAEPDFYKLELAYNR